MMSATLQHIERPEQIGLAVGMRILQRVPHSGLGSEMNDSVNLVLGKDPLHGVPIREISLDEGEVLSVCAGADVIEPRILDSGVVVVIEIVQADYMVAAGKQAVGCKGTYEAGRAGYENMHRRVSELACYQSVLRPWPASLLEWNLVLNHVCCTSLEALAAAVRSWRPWLASWMAFLPQVNLLACGRSLLMESAGVVCRS